MTDNPLSIGFINFGRRDRGNVVTRFCGTDYYCNTYGVFTVVYARNKHGSHNLVLVNPRKTAVVHGNKAVLAQIARLDFDAMLVAADFLAKRGRLPLYDPKRVYRNGKPDYDDNGRPDHRRHRHEKRAIVLRFIKRYELDRDETLDRFEKRQDAIEFAKYGHVLPEDEVPF